MDQNVSAVCLPEVCLFVVQPAPDDRLTENKYISLLEAV